MTMRVGACRIASEREIGRAPDGCETYLAPVAHRGPHKLRKIRSTSFAQSARAVDRGRTSAVQHPVSRFRPDDRMSAQTDNDPLLGQVLDGKFTLQSVLGRGGMGVVYRAFQSTLERPVALKLMRGFTGEEDAEQREQEFQRRFFLEAATAAKLKHPNTITVFDYGSTTIDGEKVFYITMELLDGVTLSKVLQQSGPLTPLRAVHISLQICRALREAHAAGVVHRDLKPGNVMLVKNDDDDDGDFVKVLDFGLAKTKKGGSGPGQQLTKAGTFLGSPRYVAPEQIEGRAVDGRADIYSFGCVLYRMLTGRVPFDGQQAVEVMMKHLNDPVPPLATDGVVVPESLEQLVMRCLAKKAEDRPASMDDVILGLKRARGELGGMFSGNVSVPEELRARLRAELIGAIPGGAGAPATSRPPEQTSPSQAAPPLAGSPSASSPSLASPSSPSSPSGSPRLSASSSLTSSGLQSGEWRLGPAPEESSRSARPGRLTVVPRRRSAWPAVVGGVLFGLAGAGAVVVERFDVVDAVVARLSATPTAPPPASGVRATAPTAARLRIQTTPVGVDVFEVLPEGIRLIGLTPLTLTWDVAVGDGPRHFQLKKKGFVTSRAVVDPPSPSPDGKPVQLDVDATLRPSTTP
jgi:serine/threonine-protein kinase